MNYEEKNLLEDKNSTYFWGVDCGSSSIKVVVCDDHGNIVLSRQRKTLFPLQQHIKHALANDGIFSPFEENHQREIKLKPNHKLAATGYGRHHIPYIDLVLTEIKAHFLGVQQQLTLDSPFTIIDIGGQDAKVITVDENRIDQFVINRKCAAGTGAYIEELAHRLEVPMKRMTELAARHDKELSLNSYCTVFSAQEVIKILMDGERVENLIFALYQSVAKRILEMTDISTPTIVFTGGVMSFHPLLVDIFTRQLSAHQVNNAKSETDNKNKLFLAPNAQFCGALGAAIFALTNYSQEQES